MSNDKRHTDLRPLGEEVGNAMVAKAEKRVATVADILTLVGLFVSWGSGVEGYVALCGITLKYAPLSKRFVRWVGECHLPKLKF